MKTLVVCFCVALALLPSRPALATIVNWTGGGGTSWSANSWSVVGGPGIADTANFTDTLAVNLPGQVTSLLNADRTIGGLTFNNTAAHFHTLDLGLHTLTESGNLNFNLDQGATTTTTLRNGILTVNGSFSNINVGRAVSGSSVGIADLTGLTSLGATVQSIQVGTSTANTATGTLLLSPSNTINSGLIQIGASNSSGDTSGTLRLGLANTILAGELDISRDNSTGLVSIAAGGTVALGSSGARTLVQIANQNTNTNTVYSGKLDLTGGTFNGFVSSLIVGQNNGGGFGGAQGTLIGGNAGTIDIGATGNTANFYVGRALTGGGSANGNVDFSGLTGLTANLNTFSLGTTLSGSATGTVQLAATNTINALNIIVGSSGNGSNTLTLGRGSNTVLTNQLTIGQDYSNGLVNIPAGGSFSLGSSLQRAALFIAPSTANTNNVYTGKLDLTGAAFNGFLSQLIVGQRDGAAAGTTVGTLIGGNSGSVDIGAVGNTANVYIGRSLTGGSPVTGNVDFSGLSTLTANLNTLSLGTSQSGNAQGTLLLAASNNINALSIIVGSSGNGNSTLALGQTNSILANQITIGQDYSTGSITIPSGGTLNLGSASQRTNISIAVGTTNTNSTYGGTFNLSNATLIAYLDAVTIGNKDAQPGNEQGTFTISNRANNYVNANSIVLGGNQSTGTLNYGGGVFYAGTIAKGIGTANFAWTGGQLSVGTFGSLTLPFNLNNTGTGTLAPGNATGAIGTTTINGNYTQSASATTAIRIAGTSPATGNDQVNISGTAALAGNLNLSLTNGFIPAVGQNFLIATYASRSGSYGFVAPPSLPQNVAFQLDYATTPTQLMARMVTPVAQSYTSTASVGTFAASGSWDTRATPGTASSLSIINSGTAPQTVTVGASTTVHRITLSGTSAAMNLEVPQGIQLGIANQLVVGTNATLSGGGQVLGNVLVAGGTVAPGATPSVLQVQGDLTTQSGSAIVIDLFGPAANQGDQLAVSNHLALAGDLNVVAMGGYSPALGDTFQVLQFGSASGQFDHISLPAVGTGLTWNTSKLTTTGQISVTVPEPGSMFLVTIGVLSLCRRRQRWHGRLARAFVG